MESIATAGRAEKSLRGSGELRVKGGACVVKGESRLARNGGTLVASRHRARLAGLKCATGMLCVGLLLSEPAAAALGAARAMAQWCAVVAPSLFPFLALMPLLTSVPAAAGRCFLDPMMLRLFNLPGEAVSAMFIGMMAGSPAGAIAARRAAARSDMNRGQLQRLAIAVTGFSPAFLIGGVGLGLLESEAQGWVLFRAQMFTQLTLALLLRGCWRDRTEAVAAEEGRAEEQPVRAAVLTALTICGYMTLFGALAFAMRAVIGKGFADVLVCALDVPSGAAVTAGLAMKMKWKLALTAAVVGFGGICVGFQNLNALRGCGIPAMEYFALRLAAAVLCAAFAAIQIQMPKAVLFFGKIISGKPMAFAALAAVLLAIPGLIRLRSAIS